MRHELPEFQRVRRHYAADFINDVLSGPRGASLIELIEYDDHHYRAVFRRSYFELINSADLPSKSQWNTLKKKLKRRNRRVFVFRDYGSVACSEYAAVGPEQVCLYLDFGFLPV